MNETIKTYRIAVFYSGNIYRQRGEFTAIHNRVKEIKKNNEFIVDVYSFSAYFDKLSSIIKGIKRPDMKEKMEIDGITYNCIWYMRSHIDNITHKLLRHRTAIEINRIKRKAEMFKNYDLIYANSLFSAHIGLELKRKYNIPFVCTWHGSSIHTHPFKDKKVLKRTIKILENADMNFFVNDELLSIAKKFTNNFKSTVSYNGIDAERFRRFSIEERTVLRKKMGIEQNDKCIAFIGNCLPIKNVQYLPKLFSHISNEITNSKFYIIGDGAFAQLFSDYEINVNYVNNISNTEMPNWYNVMDLIVMPSKNEGLPMTCLEATACGTPFVGSRVGAIADVVGFENTVERNSEFDELFATLCVKRLNNIKRNIELPIKFRLLNIIKKEIEILNTVIKNNK